MRTRWPESGRSRSDLYFGIKQNHHEGHEGLEEKLWGSGFVGFVSFVVKD
jgi:hypothetical protein